jgi:hypothetical protein
LGVFQDVTMRLIAERALDLENETYVDRELLREEVRPLPAPKAGHMCHVYCSSANAGAFKLVEELTAKFEIDLQLINRETGGEASAGRSKRVCSSMKLALSKRNSSAGRNSQTFAKPSAGSGGKIKASEVEPSTAGQASKPTLVAPSALNKMVLKGPQLAQKALQVGTQAATVQARRLFSKYKMLFATTNLDQIGECDHMLVYLNQETWTRGDLSTELADEIRIAMDKNVHLLLTHESKQAPRQHTSSPLGGHPHSLGDECTPVPRVSLCSAWPRAGGASLLRIRCVLCKSFRRYTHGSLEEGHLLGGCSTAQGRGMAGGKYDAAPQVAVKDGG